MDGGETNNRHPGEHAGPGSPPGWYADPVRKSSLRRWDGEHWTADVDPAAVVVASQVSVSDGGRGTLNKEDVRGCFTGTLLIGGLIAGVFFLIFVVLIASMLWAMSEGG